MTHNELPHLTPDTDLTDAGRTRLQTFLTSLQAAPGIMQAVLNAYPTYGRFNARAEQLQHGTPATQAAELVCNLAEVMLYEDDVCTLPDDGTHHRINKALKEAIAAQEEGRLSGDERRFVRMRAIVDRYAEAYAQPDQVIPEDIEAELFTITQPTGIPLPRTGATHSITQAA